jgi:hypothetical protein
VRKNVTISPFPKEIPERTETALPICHLSIDASCGERMNPRAGRGAAACAGSLAGGGLGVVARDGESLEGIVIIGRRTANGAGPASPGDFPSAAAGASPEGLGGAGFGNSKIRTVTVVADNCSAICSTEGDVDSDASPAATPTTDPHMAPSAISAITADRRTGRRDRLCIVTAS